MNLIKKKIMCKCSMCGKVLIERMPNGLYRFLFGKGFSNNENVFIPVEMCIHGNIKMRCLKRSCRKKHPNYWNIFNFWPIDDKEKKDQEEKELNNNRVTPNL